MKLKTIKFLLLLTVLPFWLAAGSSDRISVHGRVFLDSNSNGQADSGEKGIGGVAVSDGITVTVTDPDGKWHLEGVKPNTQVWICRPDDYAPVGNFWKNADGAGKLDFGLRKEPQERDFVFAVFADPHVPGVPSYERQVRTMIRNFNLLPIRCAFAFAVGDLAHSADGRMPAEGAAQFEAYRKGMSEIACPLFHAPGNHDHALTSNRKAIDTLKNTPDYDLGPYCRYFGPAYYSFDWGGVHFIVLDGTAPRHTRPGYQERISESQLKWLKADLAVQPKERPLVIFCHETLLRSKHGEFSPGAGIENIAELTALLKGRPVAGAFSGHVHKNFVLTDPEVFPAPNYVAGASTCEHWRSQNCDGTPKGCMLAHYSNGKLEVVYTGFSGKRPATLAAPASLFNAVSAREKLSGKCRLRWSVLGKGPAQAEVVFDGRRHPGKIVEQHPFWTIYEAEVDTALSYDGVIPVVFSSGEGSSTTLFTVVNGRDNPTAKNIPGCRLLFNQSFAKIPLDFYWNGKLLKRVEPGKGGGTLCEIMLPSVKKLNQLEVRTVPGSVPGRAIYRRFRIVRPADQPGPDIHDIRIDWDNVTLNSKQGGESSRTLYFGIQ
ncbi:MAG: metallophosphoesterase [Lentisphaeria bacterium]|nr:metallophosphoesterase [Lentisphaeria bacterium]